MILLNCKVHGKTASICAARNARSKAGMAALKGRSTVCFGAVSIGHTSSPQAISLRLEFLHFHPDLF